MEGVFYPLVFPVPPVKCTRNPVSAAGFLDRLKRQASQKLGAFYVFTINSSLKSSGAKGCGSLRFFIAKMHFYAHWRLTKRKICVLIHPANIIFASVTTG